MRAAAGVAARIAASISRGSFQSKSVSTSSASPSPVTSPALLQPQEPSGWSHAQTPSPTSASPRRDARTARAGRRSQQGLDEGGARGGEGGGELLGAGRGVVDAGGGHAQAAGEGGPVEVGAAEVGER